MTTTTEERGNWSIPNPNAVSFVCQYWDAEACNPENWEYKPSTYGVEGAHLVGHPGMKYWSELDGNWDNPGRKGGINLGKCREMREDIETNGINTKEGSMIYWEVGTSNKINAFHRESVSAELGIPGWMGQGVKFDNDAARVRFACKSNNRKDLVHSNSSPEDVETSVREVIRLTGTYAAVDIKREVNDLGAHLSPTTRDKIAKTIIIDFVYDDKMEQEDRYTPHNAKSVPIILEKLADPWVEDYWKNDEQVTLPVHMVNFEARIGSILSASKEASRLDGPLNIIFSVGVPIGKETLDTKRQKVFSTFLPGLEDRILQISGLTERHRKEFPWNHPDAEHRFVAQHRNEDRDTLIKIPNRNFN